MRTFEGVRVKLILEYILSFHSCMGTHFFCEMNDNKSASKQNTKIILHFSMEVIIIPHIAIGNEL